jgi:hypothetical protein
MGWIIINETEKRVKKGTSQASSYLVKTLKLDENLQSLVLECITDSASQRIKGMIEFMQDASGCDGVPRPVFELTAKSEQIIFTGNDLDKAIDFLCQTDFISSKSKFALKQAYDKCLSSSHQPAAERKVEQAASGPAFFDHDQQAQILAQKKLTELAREQLFASKSSVQQLVKSNRVQAMQILLSYAAEIGIKPQDLVSFHVHDQPTEATLQAEHSSSSSSSVVVE